MSGLLSMVSVSTTSQACGPVLPESRLRRRTRCERRVPIGIEAEECEAGVAVEHEKRGHRGSAADGPAGEHLREKDPLEPDLPEPEPVGQLGRHRRQEHEDHHEDADGERDQPPPSGRHDASGPRAGGTDAGLAKAADERIVVVGGPIAHGRSWMGVIRKIPRALSGVTTLTAVSQGGGIG